jgi:hypothetical protein
MYFNVTPNVVAGSGNAITTNGGRTTVPRHMTEVYRRQARLMHEVLRAEQKKPSSVARPFSHVLSMRADFEIIPAGLDWAWKQLAATPSRVVHQWDYAYLLRRSDVHHFLGGITTLLSQACGRPKYELCLPSHWASSGLTPILAYDLGCVRRARAGSALNSSSFLRGGECRDRSQGLATWRMTRDERGSPVWTADA